MLGGHAGTLFGKDCGEDEMRRMALGIAAVTVWCGGSAAEERFEVGRGVPVETYCEFDGPDCGDTSLTTTGRTKKDKDGSNDWLIEVRNKRGLRWLGGELVGGRSKQVDGLRGKIYSVVDVDFGD
jgi:predicted RNA-binding Zn-ribbon protein involved in translation (DUF1610 family)